MEEIIDFLEMQSIRKKPVGALALRVRKRVELARALALEPKLLVLDEPFAGMNLRRKGGHGAVPRGAHDAWGQTMILVEHDMSIVMSISERVIVLNFGEKLAEGPRGDPGTPRSSRPIWAIRQKRPRKQAGQEVADDGPGDQSARERQRPAGKTR